VDAADERRLPEARYEINRLLEDASFAAKPILIVANKCDLPHLEPEKIIQGLPFPLTSCGGWWGESSYFAHQARVFLVLKIGGVSRSLAFCPFRFPYNIPGKSVLSHTSHPHVSSAQRRIQGDGLSPNTTKRRPTASPKHSSAPHHALPHAYSSPAALARTALSSGVTRKNQSDSQCTVKCIMQRWFAALLWVRSQP